jgi:hypothetical protein
MLQPPYIIVNKSLRGLPTQSKRPSKQSRNTCEILSLKVLAAVYMPLSYKTLKK